MQPGETVLTGESALSSWSQVEVAGHPCDVFEPAERNPHGFVLLYLHGVHVTRLVDNQALSSALAEHGLPAIVPITQRSWWTDRICTEFDTKISAERHVLDNILPYIAERWGAQPPQIGLLGTSMGGQGALRFSHKHPGKFPVVAALSPTIDYQVRMKEGDETLYAMYPDPEAARQDTATLHVHPLNWPRNQFFCCDPADERWFASAEKLHMKLGALGIPHEYDFETSGGGHGFSYYNLMAPRAIAFIAERLEQERRKVR